MIVAGWGAGPGHASEDRPTLPGLWPVHVLSRAQRRGACSEGGGN